MNLRLKILSKRQIIFIFVTALCLCSREGLSFLKPLGMSHKQMIKVVLTSGSSWPVPANVSTIASVECWGGGGGSAAWYGDGYGAGGGGAYAKKTNVAVTPGGSVSYSIGAGGVTVANQGAGGDGGDTWFVSSGTILAKGGKGALKDDTNYLGGTGGSSASSIGTVVYSGGNGGASNYVAGAGGGASASSTGNGANGANSASSSLGGAGGASPGAGAGGTGGTSSATAPTAGTAGVDNAKGGGGGGGGGGNTGSTGPGGLGGRGGFPGGGAGAQGGNWHSESVTNNSGAGGQIIIIYKR